MYEYREFLKLRIAFDAFYLERDGYWGCIRCGTHNLTSLPRCSVCGRTCWKLLMPTELLSLGPVSALVQNRIYACPASRCLLFCDVAAATFEQSNVVTMVPAVALTPDANEQIEVAGGFIRCTSGNVNVRLVKA